MTLLEAIDRRHSVRRYSGDVIEPDKENSLRESIANYNKQGKLNIEWVSDGSAALRGRGKFHGVRALIALKAPSAAPRALEQLGYYGEYLVLEAVSLGLSACFVSAFSRDNRIFHLAKKERILAVLAVGYPEGKAGRPAHRKTPEEISMIDCQVPDWFPEGVNAAAKAPSSHNRQPVMFFCMNQFVFASVRRIDGFYPMDLGIAKANFEIAAGGKFEFGNGGLFTKQKKSKKTKHIIEQPPARAEEDS